MSSFDRSLFWRISALIFIALLVVTSVWPGMVSRPFTDDVFQLEKSSQITKWTEIFQPDAFNFFRPVKNAIFMVAAPFEKNLIAWHWIGLAAYLAAGLGIYKIASICLSSKRAALIAMAVWALSPTCASTAIWLSCANISLGVAFGALVFHFHERMMLRGSLAAQAGCVLFYVLSLLCYEAMIAVPGLLFLRDLQQKRIRFDRKTVIRYGIYTLVALGFLVLRHQFSAKSFGSAEFHTSFAPDTKGYQLSLSAPWFLWRHFLMWIFPFGTIELLGSYGWLRSTTAAGLVFGWVFLGFLLGLASYTWKRHPSISYGVLFFIVASIPAGNFLPGFNGPINDAYLTIPSIGLAMVCASLCERLIAEYAARRRLVEAGAPAILAVLALILIYRLPVCAAYFRFWAETWNSPVKLVLLMSETRPFQFQSKAYASVLLFEDGYIEQAQALAMEALEEAPWSNQAILTLARIAEYQKNHRLAESYYGSILSSKKLAENMKTSAMVELAGLLAAFPNRREEAAGLCREVLGQKSAGPRAHVKMILLLAKIYEDQQKPDKARATLERGLSHQPDNEEIKKRLASLKRSASSVAPQSR
jgi:Tetratricopeptide repeat